MGEAMGNPVCKLRDATKRLVAMEKEWLEKLTKQAEQPLKAARRPTASKKAPGKTKARKAAARKKPVVPKPAPAVSA
jgi:hypothetical protein